MHTAKNEVQSKITKLRKKGLSYTQIASKLNDEGVKSTRGGKITPSLVSYVLTSKNSAKSPKTTSFNNTWVRKVLTEKTLQDGEKIRMLGAYFNI